MAEVSKLHDFIKEISDKNGYKDAHIEIKAISSNGANYTSDLFLANVSAPPKSDLKLFAKVSNLSESIRGEKSQNVLFEKERIFYSKIAVAFENLYKKHNVPEEERLYILKYYGYKETAMEETLVLENLVVKGFGDFDRMKTFNWDYASKAVEALAKFHALGVAYSKENPEEFNSVRKEIAKTNDIFDNVKKMMVKQAIKISAQVVKKGHHEKILQYLNKNNTSDVLDKIYSPVGGRFLVHGDYRPSNLMHRRRNGKIELIPLDYQACYMGSFVTDLTIFIWIGSDSHFRKYYYNHLIEHYYLELAKALQYLDIDIEQIYPRKVFEQELEDAKPVVLVMGLALTGILTVEPENAPNFENYEDVLVSPNQLAVDRINGIVEDYVQWGII